MKRTHLFILFLLTALTAPAQNRGRQEEIRQLIAGEPWAAEVYQKLQARTAVYAAKDRGWLSDRLQMHWNTHATDIWVKGDYFDHAEGGPAPLPTMMLSGARSHATDYQRPKLEELQPRQEDPRGMLLKNKKGEQEWVPVNKTGNIIQSINQEIAGIARDAAFLWWVGGDERFAELAADVFDTYMMGIYYRHVPLDVEHGHIETLVGMATFEVIHENILDALVPLYDFLYDYLRAHRADHFAFYQEAFRKWANCIIDNGVPHNNWDLIQLHFIMEIAQILETDATYADGRGKEWYTDFVVNGEGIRQWSLSVLADYGFDPQTAIWCECPGYSMNVVGDYADFVQVMDELTGEDLTAALPVIPRAVSALPQYLFPNRMLCGWGDTHPGPLRAAAFEQMVRNAQRHGKRAEEERFTALLRLFDPRYGGAAASGQGKPSVAVSTFFQSRPLTIDTTVQAARIEDCVSATFFAPGVGWFVQRNGMDPLHSLMISENSSLGNHMHANGISMELYGCGYVLAPDAGIGRTLYSGQDYLEWYSRFPAHNTVCVDGMSDYPVMKSNHGLTLNSCHPAPGTPLGTDGQGFYSYSDVSFLEPETQSDQRRMMGIVCVGDTGGYYVDLFRSRRRDGKDQTHDYFYHNLGQQMTLTASDGSDLALQSTQELAFAGGHLYAYSYIYDKKSTETSRDVRVDFVVTPEQQPQNPVTMRMWMKGSEQRTVFQALSPMTEGLTRIPDPPYKIADQPTLTYVARQRGEAWTRPFVAVFEPSSQQHPRVVERVEFPAVDDPATQSAVKVTLVDGTTDYILTNIGPRPWHFTDGKVTVDAEGPWTVKRIAK